MAENQSTVATKTKHSQSSELTPGHHCQDNTQQCCLSQRNKLGNFVSGNLPVTNIASLFLHDVNLFSPKIAMFSEYFELGVDMQS